MTPQPESRLRVAIVVFPEITQLDATGPAEVFAASGHCDVDLVAASLDPIRTDGGWAILPTATFGDLPQADLLLVPGGAGVDRLLGDDEAIGFVRRQADGARWVTSVCTGALVLGAAGLLRGRRATTHWSSHHYLGPLGAIPVHERVVRDGTLWTSAGVSAGIDMAIAVVAAALGEPVAAGAQLEMEYAPEPPFGYGTPSAFPRETVETIVGEVSSRRDGVVAGAVQRLILEKEAGIGVGSAGAEDPTDAQKPESFAAQEGVAQEGARPAGRTGPEVAGQRAAASPARRSALLVIDLQNDVLAGAWEAGAVVERTAGLVEHAREAGVPVVWIQHADAGMPVGSLPWELDGRLMPAPGDRRFGKEYSDSFSNPELEPTLRGIGVSRLVLAGAQSDFCVRNTFESALVRGFDAVLVSDCHTTLDREYAGRIVPAAEIVEHVSMVASGPGQWRGATGSAVLAADVTW